MMKKQIWKKHSQEEISARIKNALSQNINFIHGNIMGVPASYLDSRVFSQDVGFIKDAPYISTLLHNPNHIGCHTLGKSEPFFTGTQDIEREVIDICAVDILKADRDQYDGYVASGGTEANIQALWIYRNYFQQEHKAALDEMVVLCTSDTHYSMNKGGNLLMIDVQRIQVDEVSRSISQSEVAHAIDTLQGQGKKYFIIVANMMTTMFGSVDDVSVYTDVLVEKGCIFKLHVDGAYGGFYYPFTQDDVPMNFKNEHISSVTLDAHKMAQAPYGTGIFLIRKGMIQYANTQEASYVEGEDFTLIGSRSGANAVAVWMILVKNGPYGWEEKVLLLQNRTDRMCQSLQHLGIEHYRHPYSNIVTIRSKHISEGMVKEYGLVPDNHHDPKWYKIVVMDHVTIEKLNLIEEDFVKMMEA